MKFVVIGGDAAGMSAASKARRNDPEVEVTVLEASTDVSYSACGMPYNVADADRDMDDLVVRKAEVFRARQGIDLRLDHTVKAIDRHGKKVLGTTTDGGGFEVPYDKLLIATGARARRLDVPGGDLPGVKSLKSLQDGREIKSYLVESSAKRVLIIGMGYIGLEMAEAFHERGMKVEMVEMMPRLLPYVPEEMADLVLKELASKGVGGRLGTGLKAIESASAGMRAILDEGELDTDMVLAGIGVVPNSELAADAGLELGPKNAIAVDKSLRTSDPDIFAAGDCADAYHVVTGQRVWIPLALRANRAGWAAADNVTGDSVELPGVVGTSVFKVFDLEVAATGLSVDQAAEAGFDPVENMIKSRSRAHAHPGNQTLFVNLVADRKTGRLLGGSMVGKEGAAHRIDAVAVALHAGMTVPEFFQCDMAYAPPFSPVWDPLLTAANQLLKQL
ncbi:MAG: FAD-dependent oxidoreductase [Desulfomonilaceae bacterium]|nr:FAD-dependent oxidoreductase [Desulfomonilaceae bacterium]